jgi:hypothetical protein
MCAEFMKPESALKRLVEDDQAPVVSRVEALRQLAHPPLNLLRRLLVDTKYREKPVPPRVRALAALRYVTEIRLQEERRQRRKQAAQSGQDLTAQPPLSALGI